MCVLELIKTSEDARITFIQLEKIGISSQNYLLDEKSSHVFYMQQTR